jgi:hypothetical protein
LFANALGVFCDCSIDALLLPVDDAGTMDSLTGWAGKMFLKQKMGNISDSLPTAAKAKDDPFQATKQQRADLRSSRTERDAEAELRKSQQAERKGKMADRWAANKKASS